MGGKVTAENKPNYISKPNWITHNLNVYVILLFTTWIAHFFYFGDFGLYEDDYAFVGYAMAYDLDFLLGHIKNTFMKWPQGRPIGFTLPQTIAFISTKIGGLQVLYLFGFFFVAVNTILFYKVLKNRFPEMLAFFGALTFCLFPADTTHTLLTHNLILQPSLMFMLIASHLYLAGKKKTSYIVILGSLLSYESGFLPFLAIPLLKGKWDKKLFLSIIKHIIILSFIIVCYAIIRKYMGESRVNDLNPSVIYQLFLSVFIGSVVSLLSFAYGPLMTLKAIAHGNYCVALSVIGCLIIFFYFFYKRYSSRVGMMNYPLQFQSNLPDDEEKQKMTEIQLATLNNINNIKELLLSRWISAVITGLMISGLPFLFSHRSVNPVFFDRYSDKAITIIAIYIIVLLLALSGTIFSRKVRDFISKRNVFGKFAAAPEEFLKVCNALLVGAIMLFLAYILSFTHFPPMTLFGRGTSVHLAATFGGALVCGALCYAVFLLLYTKRLKLLGAMSVAFFFALLVGYGFVIQHDFKQSWQNQRWFWSSVIEKCPDLSDGTMIFVVKEGLPETKYINTNSWADPIILKQIFEFPRSWEKVPRLWVVDKNWTTTIVTKDDVFRWKVPTATWWSYWTDLPKNNIILLKIVDGELIRCYDSLLIGKKALPVKKIQTSELISFKKGHLFDYLIQR